MDDSATRNEPSSEVTRRAHYKRVISLQPFYASLLYSNSSFFPNAFTDNGAGLISEFDKFQQLKQVVFPFLNPSMLTPPKTYNQLRQGDALTDKYLYGLYESPMALVAPRDIIGPQDKIIGVCHADYFSQRFDLFKNMAKKHFSPKLWQSIMTNYGSINLYAPPQNTMTDQSFEHLKTLLKFPQRVGIQQIVELMNEHYLVLTLANPDKTIKPVMSFSPQAADDSKVCLLPQETQFDLWMPLGVLKLIHMVQRNRRTDFWKLIQNEICVQLESANPLIIANKPNSAPTVYERVCTKMVYEPVTLLDGVSFESWIRKTIELDDPSDQKALIRVATLKQSHFFSINPKLVIESLFERINHVGHLFCLTAVIQFKLNLKSAQPVQTPSTTSFLKTSYQSLAFSIVHYQKANPTPSLTAATAAAAAWEKACESFLIGHLRYFPAAKKASDHCCTAIASGVTNLFQLCNLFQYLTLVYRHAPHRPRIMDFFTEIWPWFIESGLIAAVDSTFFQSTTTTTTVADLSANFKSPKLRFSKDTQCLLNASHWPCVQSSTSTMSKSASQQEKILQRGVSLALTFRIIRRISQLMFDLQDNTANFLWSRGFVSLGIPMHSFMVSEDNGILVFTPTPPQIVNFEDKLAIKTTPTPTNITTSLAPLSQQKWLVLSKQGIVGVSSIQTQIFYDALVDACRSCDVKNLIGGSELNTTRISMY